MPARRARRTSWILALALATVAGCAARSSAPSQGAESTSASRGATSAQTGAEIRQPSTTVGVAADEDEGGGGGAGADMLTPSGAGSGDMEAAPPHRQTDIEGGGEPEIVWTSADREALVHYSEWMRGYERRLGSVAQAADCGTACSLVGQICELAARICDIAERHPEDPSIEERCHDGRRRCTQAHQDVARQCTCGD